MPKSVRQRTKRLTNEQQLQQRRLRERRELRAAVQAQRDIERSARDLDRAILRSRNALIETMRHVAEGYYLRIVPMQARDEELKELERLRAELETAHGRIEELERHVVNAVTTITDAVDRIGDQAPRELTIEPVDDEGRGVAGVGRELALERSAGV